MFNNFSIVFIILGSIPFIAYIKYLNGDKRIFLNDLQIKTFFKIIIFSILLMFIYLSIKNQSLFQINLREIVKHMPKSAHPMDVARTVVSVMGLEDKDTSNNSPVANIRKAIRIFAKTPTALAAFFRARKGKNVIPPKKGLGFSENFFYMCFGKIPSKEIIKTFDISLILYAEHSFNVSTFTARTITSSLSDIHGAITGAIASLKGPLHGGANEEVMHMMNKIKKPENALKWINNALKNKEVVMGFGHRVYKNYDPRAAVMKKSAHEVLEELNKSDDPLLKVALELESIALKDAYFIEKKLYPNVDFYSGLVYRKLGIPRDVFTPVFAISRVAGWLAHWREQLGANRIFRPSQIYTGASDRSWVPAEDRVSSKES